MSQIILDLFSVETQEALGGKEGVRWVGLIYFLFLGEKNNLWEFIRNLIDFKEIAQ